jgi:hypothetical protein
MQFVKRLLHNPALTDADIDQSCACFGTKDFQLGYREFLKKLHRDLLVAERPHRGISALV